MTVTRAAGRIHRRGSGLHPLRCAAARPAVTEPGRSESSAGVPRQPQGDDRPFRCMPDAGRPPRRLGARSRSRRTPGSRPAWPPPGVPGPAPGPRRRRSRRGSSPIEAARRRWRRTPPGCSAPAPGAPPLSPHRRHAAPALRARAAMPGAPMQHRMHLATAGGVRRLPCGSHCLERHLPQLSVARVSANARTAAITAPWLRSEAVAGAREPRPRLRR